jgi:archaellum component FlaC
VILNQPKSEAESVKALFWQIYSNPDEINAENMAGAYQSIDEEFANLHNDMEMVEEAEESAVEELEEIKEALKDLKKNFKTLKRHEVLAEIERMLL